SGAHTPAQSPRERGETKKNPNTLPVWVYLSDSLKPTKTKNNQNGSSIADMRILSIVAISTTIMPPQAINILSLIKK
ncbi:hypothetical protein, partial [Enterobacter intestinihominis]